MSINELMRSMIRSIPKLASGAYVLPPAQPHGVPATTATHLTLTPPPRTAGVSLLVSVSGQPFPLREGLTDGDVWAVSGPHSSNSLHTRTLAQPGHQTLTNHHLVHCQTYHKPTYAMMQ